MSESRPGTVVVTAVDRLTMADAAEQSFVSTDGGNTFTTAPSVNDLVWDGSLFASATSGVVIEGPAFNRIAYTTDGGATWQMSTLSAGSSDISGLVLGSLFLYSDGRIGVTGSEPDASGTSLVTFASTDGGASFDLVTSTGEHVPATDGQGLMVMGSSDDDLWAIAGSGTAVWRSEDGGLTWRQVVANGLGAGATSVSVTGSDTAVVSTAVTTCTGKTSCVTTEGAFQTSDGGATWQSTD